MSLTLNFKQKIQANKTTADLNNKKVKQKIEHKKCILALINEYKRN